MTKLCNRCHPDDHPESDIVGKRSLMSLLKLINFYD